MKNLIWLLLTAICFQCTSETESTSDSSTMINREYRLIAFMTGYIGSGGEIDGIRNPVLRVVKGDHVRIVMVNGETMTHDVTIEQAGVQSASIIEEGDSTSVTFVATGD